MSETDDQIIFFYRGEVELLYLKDFYVIESHWILQGPIKLVSCIGMSALILS